MYPLESLSFNVAQYEAIKYVLLYCVAFEIVGKGPWTASVPYACVVTYAARQLWSTWPPAARLAKSFISRLTDNCILNSLSENGNNRQVSVVFLYWICVFILFHVLYWHANETLYLCIIEVVFYQIILRLSVIISLRYLKYFPLSY